ncbi:MAG: ABC transporter permease, partial [Limnochordales bacterium]
MTERTAGRRLPAAWAEVLGELALTAAAVALALLAGAALLALAGYDVRDAYYNLWDGAFGSVYSVADTLVNAMPLLFAGLAVAFAFRGGLFNIGAEGQLYAGALATAVTAAALAEWPSVPLIAAAMLAGALAGGLWGLVPGALKAKTGAHEVITTIMLNYVAILLTTHLVKQYFKAPGPVDQTALIPAHARLPELIAGTRLTWAVVIGVVLVAAVDWLLRRTSFGFDVVLVGSNPGAAVYAGVPVAARTVWTMAVSGAVAGLAGST